jgi:ABC-type multidrug transport system ATPase subunit
MDLSFEEIQMEVKLKGNGNKRTLLDGSIRGRCQPGRMLAIMGPSGSGKSTLLHALAGKTKYSPKLSLKGKRYLNGNEVEGRLPAALIEQEVSFFPHMTVRETLEFRVDLLLGRTIPKSSRQELVQDLIVELNLQKAADTIVGNNKIRGISGGERKRLSIACEMISSPSLILLDEPTSGLDSSQALQVIETLRELADSGKTVVVVIHQPNQHVFSLFDDLLLLSDGKQMYYGEVKKVRGYMANLGYKAPAEMGTAEHVLDCISLDTNDQGDPLPKSIDRLENLAKQAKMEEIDLGINREDKSIQIVHELTAHGPKASLFRQFQLLLNRAVREAFRGKGAIVIKAVQQITLGIVYGGIYHLGNNQASIQDRFGLLSLIAIGTANMAVASTIRSFPKEKTIVSNEMASHLYRTLPYFVAKALSEVPLIGVFSCLFGSIIYPLTGLQKGKFKAFLGLVTMHAIASEGLGLMLGAVSATSDIALALFPPVLVLNIIFDGKNISEENTPKLLRWIPKVGLIRWGFEGLALNEFDGLEFEKPKGPPRGPVARTGEEALDRFGLAGKSLGTVVKAQTAMIIASWALSYVGLALTKQRYQKMEEPDADDEETATKEETI